MCVVDSDVVCVVLCGGGVCCVRRLIWWNVKWCSVCCVVVECKVV